jgi:hypothetical protein
MMKFKNLQQVNEQVEVYYECLLKLANYLQVKVIDVFFITIFTIGLQPNLRLATTHITRDTIIKHKETIVICEKNGLIIANYNILIIHPKSNPIAQPIVIYTIVKQQLV